MLTNYHTHSVFCDGKNTLEETVAAAIEKGFSAIGFSGHGYTEFDLSYCMKDTDGYIHEIKRLKRKYADKIQIYLGIEEDAFCYTDRSKFDYIIGSSHYFRINGKWYSIDSDYGGFQKCLTLFGGDVVTMAHAYYGAFCDYILKRKPDIVGHFDLITKYDEADTSLFLDKKEYNAVAETYIDSVAGTGCLFEVNTGAMARGYRTSPYPAENLLYILKTKGAGIILSSDCHSKESLDFGFAETKRYLKDIGFTYTYILYDNTFVKEFL